MATNSFSSVHHHHRRRLLRRHSIDQPPSALSSTPFSTKPTAPKGLSRSIKFALSSTTPASSSSSSATPSTSQASSLDTLRRHLSSKNFRQADEETRRLLIVLAGEAAQKRGYVFFSEVQFIPDEDLRTIDELWREHSDGRFGYSVQRRIWEKANKDFTRFFLRVGWMKRLDTEVEQYNYRSFPDEFMWEVDGEASPPEGHLPLTNALRGTQLLNSILSHPAFGGDKAQVEAEDEGDRGNASGWAATGRAFSPKYSF